MDQSLKETKIPLLALTILVAGLVACSPTSPLTDKKVPIDLVPPPSKVPTEFAPPPSKIPTDLTPPTSKEPPQPATRTPALSVECPDPTGQIASISPIALGTTVDQGFRPQIVDYLNTRGSAEGLEAILSDITLDDPSTAWQTRTQVVTTDVTGDTTPEVIIDLRFFVPGQYADGGMFVFMCRDRQYEGGGVAGLSGGVFSADDPDGIRAIQDINGNGVADIVLSNIEIIGTHANFTRAFRIIEWDGNQFVDLIEEDSAFQDNAARVLNGDGEIVDTDGNGTLELLLTNGPGKGPEAGPDEQSYVEIWRWDGTAFRLDVSE